MCFLFWTIILNFAYVYFAGVLTAFSKLITKDKQHTFIETDTVIC